MYDGPFQWNGHFLSLVPGAVRARMMIRLTGQGCTMSDMGTFRTTMLIESAERRGVTRTVEDALVDTGSEFTWVPRAVLEELGIQPEFTQRFSVADGRVLERQVGIAIVHAAGAKAPDYVTFADPGDMILLGARSLQGMNLRVDPRRMQLAPAGPVLAGAAA